MTREEVLLVTLPSAMENKLRSPIRPACCFLAQLQGTHCLLLGFSTPKKVKELKRVNVLKLHEGSILKCMYDQKLFG